MLPLHLTPLNSLVPRDAIRGHTSLVFHQPITLHGNTGFRAWQAARTILGGRAVVALHTGRTTLPMAGMVGTSSTVVRLVPALVARTEDVERCGSSRTS